MKSLFKHTCDKCVYLGTAKHKIIDYLFEVEKEADLYCCLNHYNGGTLATLIARYGDGPTEFMSVSSSVFFKYNNLMQEAYNRSLSIGLITTKDHVIPFRI